MKSEPLTAVLFDWDYTLAYTTIGDNSRSTRFAAMFKLAGLSYTQTEIEAALQELRTKAQRGEITLILHPQTRQQIGWQYMHLLKALGCTEIDWTQLTRLYNTYAQLPTFLYPDARPTLQNLRQKGWVVGILSNHSHSARAVMERLVGDLIPQKQIIISGEEGVHKPAKTIFRRAAARLRTPASQCVLVGDNLQVDAVGALKNGGYGQGIWLDRKNNMQTVPEGVIRVTSLETLDTLLSNPRYKPGEQKP